MENRNEPPDEFAGELEMLGNSVETLLNESRRDKDIYRHEAEMLATELKLKEMIAGDLDKKISARRQESDRRTAELAAKAKGLRLLLLKKCGDLKAYHEKLRSEIALREARLEDERRRFESASAAQSGEIDRLNSELHVLRNRYGAMEKIRQALLCRIAGLAEANEKLALFRKDQERAKNALEKELEKKEQDRIREADRAALELLGKTAGFRAALAKERENFRAAYEKLEREAADCGNRMLNELLALKEAARRRDAEPDRLRAELLDAEARQEIMKAALGTGFRAALAKERENFRAAYEKLEREAADCGNGPLNELLALKEAARRRDAELDRLRAELLDAEARQEILKAALGTGQPDAARMLEEVLARKCLEMEKLEAETRSLKNTYDAVKSGLESALSEIQGQSALVRSLLSGPGKRDGAPAPPPEKKE